MAAARLGTRGQRKAPYPTVEMGRTYKRAGSTRERERERGLDNGPSKIEKEPSSLCQVQGFLAPPLPFLGPTKGGEREDRRLEYLERSILSRSHSREWRDTLRASRNGEEKGFLLFSHDGKLFSDAELLLCSYVSGQEELRQTVRK